MRNAETVLGIIQERGRKALPLEDIYRQLYNPDLYRRAYARLATHPGAMTPGVTTETVDGMSQDKIAQIIADVRAERFRWTPVKRVYIPKKSGTQMRPLGLPTWRDKLLQEVIRSILEAYYEPQFSAYSHGFRPGRGCHSALEEVAYTWRRTHWFIEGDIKACFDRLNHQVLLRILAVKLHDQRFLRLIQTLLQAGYLEDWQYHATLSGSPQGGGVSPILANVYLDQLDQFVEQVLIPENTRGKKRKDNPAYNTLLYQRQKAQLKGHFSEAKRCFQQAQQLPRGDPQDPNYRRLRYIRYADDVLLGFAGPKAEAETIKQRLATFLHNQLDLELSQAKTLITHASTQAARFLGYELVVHLANSRHDQRGRGSLNGAIGLRVPLEVLNTKCAQFIQQGKIHHRPELLQDDDFSIMTQYQAEYRGIVQYYLLAENVGWLSRLRWVMQGSLLRTLACKHRSSQRKIKRKYQSMVDTPTGKMKCLEIQVPRVEKKPLIARFGGIPLRQQQHALLKDRIPLHYVASRAEILKRFLADRCEICGNTGHCEVHHIRKLADLKMKGRKEKPFWMQMMAARQRKTLVVCQNCHRAIHAGKLPTPS